jgi:hypothetical protein
MKAAALGLALLVGASPCVAAEENWSAPNAVTECELVLAIWTQYWNQAPGRSLRQIPYVVQPLDCAWNVDADENTSASFSSPVLTHYGRTASIQVGRIYGPTSNMYDCRLIKIGDYWRVNECVVIGIGDSF